MKEEPFDFGDPENYRSDADGKMTPNEIILRQIQQIGRNANVEFRGGYWNKKVVPMQGGVTKIVEEYIPDTRDIYSNSVEFLQDFLHPNLGGEFKKASDEYDKAIETMREEYLKDGKFTDDEKMQFKERRLRLAKKLFRSMCSFLNEENFGEELSN